MRCPFILWKYQIERDLLEINAKITLGPDNYEGIKKWYMSIVDNAQRYTVFMVRRSYLLALLMEEITQKKMTNSLGVINQSDKEFLTDAAFLMRCDELADYYREKKRFPQILLCDDILLHGRGVNHYIENLEYHIHEYLPELSRDEIKFELVRSINIQIFIRNQGMLVLFGRYEHSLKYCVRGNLTQIHQISSNISKFISISGIANASYIYSEEITPQQLKEYLH